MVGQMDEHTEALMDRHTTDRRIDGWKGSWTVEQTDAYACTCMKTSVHTHVKGLTHAGEYTHFSYRNV